MEAIGHCDARFAPVRRAFESTFGDLGERGAAVCVRMQGRAVVDLAGGETGDGRRWHPDTLACVYSVGKPLAATPLLQLVDRGRVHLDDPVCAHWPEFAAAGKETVTVRWLLAHRTGLLGLRTPLPPGGLLDWTRVVTRLAAERPWVPPGGQPGEQARFYGHLVGELVRRVTGRAFAEVFRDAVARPWALDVHFGVPPADLGRCASIEGFDARWRAAHAGEPGTRRHAALSEPPDLYDVRLVNGERWRRGVAPAVNAHASARGIARFYEGIAAGGVLDAERLVSAALVEQALAVQAEGVDAVFGDPVRWGLGFQLDEGTFGLGGIGGSVGLGSRAHGLGFAYVTRRMDTHARADRVLSALGDVLGVDF